MHCSICQGRHQYYITGSIRINLDVHLKIVHEVYFQTVWVLSVYVVHTVL